MADTPEQQSAAALAQQRFVADFVLLMEQADFRRFLYYVIDDPAFCKTHGLSADWGTGLQPEGVTPIPPDPLRAYYQEGRRSIGVALILTAQRLSPKRYMNMLTEALGLRNQQPNAPVAVPTRK